jgi:hypothetical protein
MNKTRMRLAGHVARMREKRTEIGYWCENEKKIDH